MTSEPNRNKNANRWQELADQLGLADEGHQASVPAKSEAPAPAPAPEERHVPAARHQPRPEIHEAPALAPSPVEPPAPETTHRQPETHAEPVSPPSAALVEAVEDTSPIQSESSPDSILEAESEGPPNGDESASTRTAGRRRRRRRSSGKNKRDEGPQGQEAPIVSETQESPETQPVAQASIVIPEKPGPEKPAPAPREEPAEDAGGQRGRPRGRGHRRRDDEPEVAAESIQEEDEVHESGGPVGFEDESDDDEVVNYSNWTVPAWKDLIGSLYRPER